MTIRVAACQIDPQPGEVDRNLERIERAVAEAGFGRATCRAARGGGHGYVFEHLDEALTVAQRASVVAEQRLADLAAANRVALIVGSLEAEGRGSSTPPSSSPRTAAAIGTGRCTFRTWASTDSPPRPGRARGVRPGRDARRGPHLLRPALPGGGAHLRPGRSRPHRAAHQLAGRGPVPSRDLRPARAAENHVYLLACDRVGEERGTTFIGRSILLDTNGRALATASDTEEETILGEVDWELARQTHHRRIPGEHEWDTIGDRRPGLYARLLEPARDRLHPPSADMYSGDTD